MNSPSAWFCAHATLTSSPSDSWGLILRARSWRSETGSWLRVARAPAAAGSRGRSALRRRTRTRRRGQTSGGSPDPVAHRQPTCSSTSDDLAVADPERADLGRVAGEPDDHVQGLGIEGEVDVGLGGERSGPGVRMIDRAEIEPVVVDRHLDPVLLGAVDLVAQRAGGGVDGRIDLHRLAVARRDHPAALVRRLGLRVGDDLVVELAGDAHRASRLAMRPGPKRVIGRPARGRTARLRPACTAAAGDRGSPRAGRRPP